MNGLACAIVRLPTSANEPATISHGAGEINLRALRNCPIKVASHSCRKCRYGPSSVWEARSKF
jgi:hypothetical protein